MREFVDFGRYSVSVIVDGERIHAYESTALSGERDLARPGVTWVHDSGEPAHVDDFTSVPTYQYTVVVDGEVEHRYGRSGQYAMDDDGELVVVDGDHDEDWAEFESFATYHGRRAVIGIDDAGERMLLTSRGQPIDEDVDWGEVAEHEPGPLEGEPLAIGDYVIDMRAGDVRRVYLFPDGSQAVRDEAGNFDRVIVPTDQEYPDGRPFFEGRFLAEDRALAEEAEFETSIVFSFRDGQTAVFDDGELVLVDVPVESTYPDGPPVNCGRFPGGELFVFPDGQQLIRANNGTWGVGSLPDLPSYDELVVQFGEPGFDDLELPAPADIVLPADLGDRLLDDDITGIGMLSGSLADRAADGAGDAEADDGVDAITEDPSAESVDDAMPPDDAMGADESALLDDPLADPLGSDLGDPTADPLPPLEEPLDDPADDPLDDVFDEG